MKLELTILGEVAAKARAKHFYDAKTKRGWSWTPKKTADCEKNIAMHLMEARAKQGWDKPSDKPISLTVKFYRPIPASTSKKNRVLAIAGSILPTKKPDLDNMVKTIKDSASKIIWNDDSQVCFMVALKHYSDNPRTELIFEEIELTGGTV
jgi:Holliday junction resolvase RusA-like endonuclease